MQDLIAPPVLDVRSLTKAFGAMKAVDAISFRVHAGEILVIVGGSGCGKTTTLRCIAGLEDLTDGEIHLDGALIASPRQSVAPERRGIGMVFQSYALWPHKTIFQNVAYGLERRGLNGQEITAKVQEVLTQVSLQDFAERDPSSLSGGQQQRVALARSAVLRPRLLLLDEPLSNLDAKLRERMRDDLQDMIRMFGMTAIHITHDQEEAMALADRIICMRSGRIEQIGAPREVYHTPVNRYVADFIGSSNILEPHSIVATPQGSRAVFGAASLLSSQALNDACPHPVVAVRVEAVEIHEAAPSGPNVLEAKVTKGAYLGSHSLYHLECCGLRLVARSAVDYATGQMVHLRIAPTDVRLIDP